MRSPKLSTHCETLNAPNSPPATLFIRYVTPRFPASVVRSPPADCCCRTGHAQRQIAYMVDGRSVQSRCRGGHTVDRTVSCCGHGSRRIHCRAIRRHPAACGPIATRCSTKSRPTRRCTRSSDAARRLPIRVSPIRCTSKLQVSAAARPVLVSLHVRRRAAAASAAASTLPGSDATLAKLACRLRFVRELRTRLFRRVSPPRGRAPDLTIFLGDYIYEFVDKSPTKLRVAQRRRRGHDVAAVSQSIRAISIGPGSAAPARRGAVHRHVGRSRGAERLRRHNGRKPSTTRDDFLRRRAAAYQAFYEHMPVRPSRSLPNGAGHAHLRSLPLRRSRRDFVARRTPVP